MAHESAASAAGRRERLRQYCSDTHWRNLIQEAIIGITVKLDYELYAKAHDMAGPSMDKADLVEEAIKTFVRLQVVKRLVALPVHLATWADKRGPHGCRSMMTKSTKAARSIRGGRTPIRVALRIACSRSTRSTGQAPKWNGKLLRQSDVLLRSMASFSENRH